MRFKRHNNIKKKEKYKEEEEEKQFHNPGFLYFSKEYIITVLWIVLVAFLMFMLLRFVINDMRIDGGQGSISKNNIKVKISSLREMTLSNGQAVNVHDYSGFRVYFNRALHIPNCITYSIIADQTLGNVPQRRNFEIDPHFVESAYPSDYSDSYYVRGQLAPTADMRWDSNAMSETFYMSNVAPFDPKLYNGTWQKLESQIRRWTQRDSVIVVATGPIINRHDSISTIGEHCVAVPKAYFKVIFAPCVREPRAIGFIFPNTPCEGEDFRKFVVSVDEIEHRTGYDFLYHLEDKLENLVEKQCDIRKWESP